MMTRIHEYEVLSDVEKRSLLFLRGQRDRLASDLALDVSSEKAEEWINDIVTYRCDYASSARDRLRQYFSERDNYTGAEKAAVLFKLSARIARLEREACGVPIYGHDLVNA